MFRNSPVVQAKYFRQLCLAVGYDDPTTGVVGCNYTVLAWSHVVDVCAVDLQNYLKFCRISAVYSTFWFNRPKWS